MRTVFKTLISVGIAFILALGGLWCTINPQRYEESGIKNGPWATSLEAGSEEGSIYHRARVSIYGLWALEKSEVIYYVATTDSDGMNLDYNYNYTIEGKDLPARWWSITVYKDLYLIPNEKNRYSYSKTNILYNDGKNGTTWTIRLSSKPQEGNWLPLGDKNSTSGKREGILCLTLRLYNPDPEVLKHPDTIQLPYIIREE
jgi:Uncharacterized conserved protein